jgi:hypothetical protein
MTFKLVGKIERIEVIAVGRSIRTLPALKRRFGSGRWRKLKGMGLIELSDESVRLAELHWYEAHGIGRVLMKVKCYVD